MTAPGLVPDGVEVHTTRSPDGAELDIATHGAQVLGWRPASGGERLWLSSGPAAPLPRGGVPVIFPQFSDRGPLPKHGFARDLDWRPVAVDGGRAMLTLTADERSRQVWPHEFELVLTAEVVADRLEIDLTVTNIGATRWSFQAALHCYLQVGRAAGARVTGLGDHDGQDQAAGLAPVHLPPGDLVVPPSIDLAVLGAHGPRRLVPVREPEGSSAAGAPGGLVLTSGGFPDTVVWHPGDDHPSDVPADEVEQFLCVEPAALDPVPLGPGQVWRGALRITAVADQQARADDPNGVRPGG